MIEKRNSEEKLLMISEWGFAKQRVCEEMTCKNERSQIASNPSKVSVMTQPGKIANLEKIYKSKEEFLDSNVSSLNTTGKSEEMRKAVEETNRILAEKARKLLKLSRDSDNDEKTN
jgi:hypothetical protein